MSFASDVQAFTALVGQRAHAVHEGVCDLAFTSIVEGSPVTGAPGQPVDTGFLKSSWQRLIDDWWTQRIITNTIYAEQIEDGSRNGRALTLRSQVGGFHSVELTRAAWTFIVAKVTADVVGSDV